jgi:hypothetical protein
MTFSWCGAQEMAHSNSFVSGEMLAGIEDAACTLTSDAN